MLSGGHYFTRLECSFSLLVWGVVYLHSFWVYFHFQELVREVIVQMVVYVWLTMQVEKIHSKRVKKMLKKTTLETSEEDVDKTTLEASV